YRAASWKTARRVVAKIEFHCGELFPRVGFIVTKLETDSRAVVRFYNKRGTAEQWIKEDKQAVKMTRLSCHRFRSKEVRLMLSLIAYNLGNLWTGCSLGRVLPKQIENWSLTSLQHRLVETGGRLVKRARYYWLMLAESHLTRRLFGSMVRRIEALPAGGRSARRGGNLGRKGAGGRGIEMTVGNRHVVGFRFCAMVRRSHPQALARPGKGHFDQLRRRGEA
ncbi:MAG: transposase, partial [Acidobacteria bacterium]|nr:transposase [Acidobacteriota bacterium]